MCRGTKDKQHLITQAEIEQLLVLRQQARGAQAVAAKKQEKLDAEEGRLTAALWSGMPVEPQARGRAHPGRDGPGTGGQSSYAE